MRIDLSLALYVLKDNLSFQEMSMAVFLVHTLRDNLSYNAYLKLLSLKNRLAGFIMC